MIKKTLIVAGVLVVALLIFAATKPDTFHVFRTASINASPATVYALLHDFHEWPAWSPFESLDPEMRRAFGGSESGAGAIYEWDGDRRAGQGRMEIVQAVPGERLEIQLDFLRPWRSTNRVGFELVDAGGHTDVTWSMTGPNSYFGKVMSVVMSFDRLIGRDYEEGLANLKSVAEAVRDQAHPLDAWIRPGRPYNQPDRPMSIQIRELPSIRVGAVRHVGPYHELQAAFRRVGAIAAEAGLFGREGVSVMGIFHDHSAPVPENEIRSDAAVSVPEGVDVPEGLTEQHVPAGRYAHLIHEGSYGGLADSWRRLTEGLGAQGHRPAAGPSIEIYLNAPGQVPDSELRTELFMPIE
jgi:DNA gyrase inhibitor GyrI/uncharacterized protein YndB with AHSA1/START domain